jgi:hypothetical protein
MHRVKKYNAFGGQSLQFQAGRAAAIGASMGKDIPCQPTVFWGVWLIFGPAIIMAVPGLAFLLVSLLIGEGDLGLTVASVLNVLFLFIVIGVSVLALYYASRSRWRALKGKDRTIHVLCGVTLVLTALMLYVYLDSFI